MSELRRDIVSGDWVIMAPERAKRPHDFLPEKKRRIPSPKSKCPFEKLEETGNWPPILLIPNNPRNWKVAVIPNKYPALTHTNVCGVVMKSGLYDYRAGTGYHDLVVSRDHRRNIADLPFKEAMFTFDAIRERFRMVKQDPCMMYVAAFFNWGPTAGASLFHPHYQMLSLPIIPPAVEQSLKGSATYFRKNHRCVHCDILKEERKVKKRIIAENAQAIAISPYVPKSRFEISIYPARHHASFEETPRKDMQGVVKILRFVLQAMKKRLHDPDLNFFIHSAPLRDGSSYRHYHWHIDVIPKILIPAGFELSTGVDINVIDPDWFAALLRGKRNS